MENYKTSPAFFLLPPASGRTGVPSPPLIPAVVGHRRSPRPRMDVPPRSTASTRRSALPAATFSPYLACSRLATTGQRSAALLSQAAVPPSQHPAPSLLLRRAYPLVRLSPPPLPIKGRAELFLRTHQPNTATARHCHRPLDLHADLPFRPVRSQIKLPLLPLKLQT